jgi:hypothetical protein
LLNLWRHTGTEYQPTHVAEPDADAASVPVLWLIFCAKYQKSIHYSLYWACIDSGNMMQHLPTQSPTLATLTMSTFGMLFQPGV